MPIIVIVEHTGRNLFVKAILAGRIRLSERVSALPAGIFSFPAFYKETYQ